MTVRLDPDKKPPVWSESEGGRWDVLWPESYRLVADRMAVIDGRGTAILRDGERREIDICATPDDRVVIFAGAP